jgi:uncharacterized protein
VTTQIVVLADTHMPHRARTLPETVLQAIRSAQLVIHLGDFTELEVLQSLQLLAPLAAVHGNNDSDDIRSRFPAFLRLSIEGQRLVLLHGDVGGRTALACARAVSDADIVLFGHSHHAWSTWENGKLLFNPGSPTDRRMSPIRSFGILEVAATVVARIVPVSDHA